MYAHAGAELTRNLSHRNVRGAGVVLNSCMGGHCIVTCNGTADLTIEGVQNGAARGIFDDELDQVHGGIGKAFGGFNEENGKMLIHEVAEARAVPGPFVRLAERKDPG